MHFLASEITSGLTGADLVHVQHEYGLFGPKSVMSWVFFPVLFVLTRLRRTPVVITVHEAWSCDTIESGPRLLKRGYILATNYLLKTVADELVFLSDSIETTFRSTVRVESATRLPHGVVFERRINLKQSDAQGHFGYSGEEPLVVEPGYVSRQKGQDRFVELAGTLPAVQFFIAGGTRSERDRPFVNSLEESLPENVSMTGVLDEESFHASFRAADIVVLPYRKDGQSGVFNWCASYEVPVIGSDCTYFVNLNDEYGCVEIFDGSDPSDMKRSVERLLSDQERYNELVSSIISYKRQESFERVVDHHVELYQGLLDS